MSSVPTIIDTHCHIYYQEYQADWDAMMERAHAAGVRGMVVIATDIASSRQVIELAEKHPNLYATVGIHPHDAAGVTNDDLSVLKQLAGSSPKVVAIGEIGLDFYRDRAPRDEQRRVFTAQLELARDCNLPVVIHDRDAHEETLALITQAGVTRGVMHCFSGDRSFAKRCINQGLYLSIPGTITYPSNTTLHDVVRSVHLEHLLVETDAPYLTPVPHRGKRNEPSYTRITAQAVADLKGVTLDDVARTTTMNAGRLFGIDVWDSSTKLAYRIRNSLYLNVTNRCSNHCTFCPKFYDFTVKGHNLLLDHEPGYEEMLAAVGSPEGITEIVFCGFGEPLIRLSLVKQLAKTLKERGYTIRINTDGQANLVHGRSILPELAGLVDHISVSLNAADAATYQELCNTPYGADGYAGVCQFIAEATRYIPTVTASAVTVPGVDIEACRAMAERLGAQFRIREYEDVG